MTHCAAAARAEVRGCVHERSVAVRSDRVARLDGVKRRAGASARSRPGGHRTTALQTAWSTKTADGTRYIPLAAVGKTRARLATARTVDSRFNAPRVSSHRKIALAPWASPAPRRPRRALWAAAIETHAPRAARDAVTSEPDPRPRSRRDRAFDDGRARARILVFFPTPRATWRGLRDGIGGWGEEA